MTPTPDTIDERWPRGRNLGEWLNEANEIRDENATLRAEKAALRGALRAAALDRHGYQCGPRVAFSDCRAGVCQRVRALLDPPTHHGGQAGQAGKEAHDER